MKMEEFQMDQVGFALVNAFIIFVTWLVTHYLGHKTVETNSTQTQTMRFTERLTNYGDKKVDMTEKFDKFCEICDSNVGNEAVGFCQMCEKFMCLNCSKHHEKIPLSESHQLIGKDKFTKVRNKKLFDRSFVILQDYCFYKCGKSDCKYFTYRNCCNDYNIQLICLAENLDDGVCSIVCFVKKYKVGNKLVLQWQDKLSGQKKEKNLLSNDCKYSPADMTTFKSLTQKFCKYYFTIPRECKICTYNDYAVAEFIHTNGECYGIAVFNEGLAISINIPTRYSLPEWQVQFISFHGYIKRQICFDNEGEPLFKEPKHLTSNNAQDILFVSDRGNHSIIALDIKGFTLFKYKHETIQQPLGLTCDDEGNIYVAIGNKVVQIDQHGIKSRVILTFKDKKVKTLIDVCYSTSSCELGVLTESSEVTIIKPLP